MVWEYSIQQFNHTLIALIPKVVAPTCVEEFRPINLFVYCSFKLIAKYLANQLKFVSPSFIHPIQCAFVSKRNILDNVMFGFKVMHACC